jgi:AcrR family transcriptional regulator
MVTAKPRKQATVKETPAKPKTRAYLSSAEREKQIIQAAIGFFAEKGFSGNTRDLTKSLGIAHGLLFKYFPTKEDLIERVYKELFEVRWDPTWEFTVRNRSLPLTERLVNVYTSYTEVINRYEWVRVYLFAGLNGTKINARYWGFVRDNFFRHVIDELRFEHSKPSVTVLESTEAEVELMWSLHSALFYMGVRKWVYMLEVPEDKTKTIRQLVEGFLDAAPRVLNKTEAQKAGAPKVDKPKSATATSSRGTGKTAKRA